MDVATFFLAHQATQGQAPVAPETEVAGGANRPAATASPLREWLCDDEVAAALADAASTPTLAAVHTLATPDQAAPPAAGPTDAAGESRQPEGARRPRKNSALTRLATVWLLASSLGYGLWRHQGWTTLHGRDRRRV
jgi:hypothetical protein